jgi:hypothetical protein
MPQIFIPTLAIAFEYQGEAHYFSGHVYGNASTRQKADKLKAQFAKSMGITLITIPFWWNRTKASLAALIGYHRPDISRMYSRTVPSLEVPSAYHRPFNYHPNACKDMKMQGTQFDPTGW